MGDVDMASLHTKLGGTRMWARPEKTLLPHHLRGMRDPLVRVEGALYGLPRAGFDWDQECTRVFLFCAWEKVEDCEGSAFHKNGVLAVVYVDDIVLGSPLHLARPYFKQLKQHLRLKEDEVYSPPARGLPIHC